MLTAVVLLITSLILIYLEFFLPGGIMGTAGGLLLIASVIFFAQLSPNIALVLLFSTVAIVGLIATIKLALYRVKRGAPENSVYLQTDQEGYRAPAFDESLVGKTGTAIAGMRPSGHIEIDGVRHQAVAKTGFINKGAEVEVIGGRSAYLIVKAKKTSST